MSDATIAMIVNEIKAHRQRDSGHLSWAALEELSTFSRVALWAKPAIRAAYQAAREDSRKNATPPIKLPRTTDDRLIAMQKALDEAHELIRVYDERWSLHLYNMERLGLDEGELCRPLDPVNRELIRRHGRKAK